MNKVMKYIIICKTALYAGHVHLKILETLGVRIIVAPTVCAIRSVEQGSVSFLLFLKRLLRRICSMSGCLFRGSSLKSLIVINRLFLPQLLDVGRMTVYSSCTVKFAVEAFDSTGGAVIVQ